jgi:SacI homology domain/Inositol phosphatase
LDAGQHAFITPIIQGFVGQRVFSVGIAKEGEDTIVGATAKTDEIAAVENDPDLNLPPEKRARPISEAADQNTDSTNTKNFLLTIISRRSIKRAGLRYLRRGVDEEGNVANSVETEQILSTPDWDSKESKIYSFVQYRGSIPVLFSQSPYSFKPVPVFYGSPETNTSAFRLHFQHLAARYGWVQVANLVEKKGNEGKVGESFEKQANSLNAAGGIDGTGNELGFEWFDFHGECRGMKFENVSRLFDKIGPQLQAFGWTVEQDGKISQAQTGVLRTNCMDCLDRTNVVQAACARNVLQTQLQDQGVLIDLHTDPSTAWFNTVWADNGDAISRQYAGTAALKGDFTRTRKRNISGALTDFGLTLTRYVKNIRDDWFTQTVIDYILGLTDETSFVEFEADMQTRDYAIDLRKVRQNAIDTCVMVCVEDGEDLVAGWTLSCPAQPNSLRSLPFEECVLLLTEQALYFCRMDWTTEKVREFERAELESIEAVARGVYITSVLARRDMDEKRNVGFVVRISGRGGRDIVRVNTRSLGSTTEGEAQQEENGRSKAAKKLQDKLDTKDKQQLRVDAGDKILAFKALPPKSSFIGSGTGEGDAEPPTEIELTRIVTDQIVRVANAVRKGDSAVANEVGPDEAKEEAAKAVEEGAKTESDEDERNRLLSVEDKDIISLADAKRSTGYLEQLGYSLKKLVWAT